MGSRVIRRLLLASAAVVSASGCVVGYIYEIYGPPLGTTLVTVGCHTTYEVTENAKEGRILVRTNIAAGVAEAICRDREGAPRPRRAVELYFAKANRPACRITDERPLSGMFWEYGYSCTP
jgi:hypothetical protein